MNTEVLPRQHWQYTMVVPQTIHSKEVNEMEQITTACECIQHCSSSDARRGEQIPTGIRSSSKPSVGNQLLGVATGWPRSEGVGERSPTRNKPVGWNMAWSSGSKNKLYFALLINLGQKMLQRMDFTVGMKLK